MKRLYCTAAIVACFALLTSSLAMAQPFPKKADDLVQKHADLWNCAVNHAFLEEVQTGSLSMEAFSTWLARDDCIRNSWIDGPIRDSKDTWTDWRPRWTMR